jgi:DNA replication protein DnaC
MSELLHQRVGAALRTLKLETAARELDRHLQHAAERDLSPLQVLDTMLGDEITSRNERGIIARTKLAHLPQIKTLDSFDFDAQPTLDRGAINELQTLAFLERHEGAALLGPPGVGKTHIAIGLGMRALQAGYRVYFLTAQDLLDQIRAAQMDGIPGHKQRHLNTVPLLIIDELGYVPFDNSAATWFFQLMCQRYERRSTIITSNKAFAEWGEIFGDTTMAGALLDRFLHHCHVLNLKGESYRMRSRRREGVQESPSKQRRRVGPS